jgi:hypothetical protein
LKVIKDATAPVTDNVCETLNNIRGSNCVLLDLSKVSDCKGHETLLDKLY